MKVFDFIIEKYIFLAICTSGLTLFSYQSFGIAADFDYVVLVGLGTLVTYNYHEWLDKSYTELLQLIRSSSGMILLVMSLVMLYLAMRLEWFEAMILLASGVLSMMYFIGMRGVLPTLRSLPWGKVIVIGLVFSLSTIVVPIISAGYGLLPIVLLSIARLLFIMALAISFDIGDQLVDYKEQSRTLPTAVGVRFAKWVALMALVTAIAIEGYWAYNFMIELPMMLALILTYIFSSILIFRSHRLQPRWYYLLLIDGMIGFPWFLSWLI